MGRIRNMVWRAAERLDGRVPVYRGADFDEEAFLDIVAATDEVERFRARRDKMESPIYPSECAEREGWDAVEGETAVEEYREPGEDYSAVLEVSWDQEEEELLYRLERTWRSPDADILSDHFKVERVFDGRIGVDTEPDTYLDRNDVVADEQTYT